jgi:hypothetical protein
LHSCGFASDQPIELGPDEALGAFPNLMAGLALSEDLLACTGVLPACSSAPTADRCYRNERGGTKLTSDGG